MKLRYAALLILLAACAPAAECVPDTAFSATVVSMRPLEVQSERGGVLNVVTTEETRIMSHSGAALTLENVTSGDSIYVRGSLEGRNVTALEVRLLNP